MKKVLIIALNVLLINTYVLGAIPKPKNAKAKNARLVKIDNTSFSIPRPEGRR